MARVAVNDAQHKKERLKLLASLGLNTIGVEVDYRHVPPRCIIHSNKSELLEAFDNTRRLMEELHEWMPPGAAVSTGYPEVLSALPDSTMEQHEVDNQSVDTSTHIQLVEDDDSETNINLNAPPVRLTIQLPHGEETRKERFIIDDFWEFIQVKFDDLGLDSSEDDAPIDNGKYEVSLDRYSPETKELTKKYRIQQSQIARAEKAKEASVNRREEQLISLAKNMVYVKRQARDVLEQVRQCGFTKKE